MRFSKLLRFALSFALLLVAGLYAADAHGLTDLGVADLLGYATTGSMTMYGACFSVASIEDEECGTNPGGTVELYVISTRDIETWPAMKVGSEVEFAAAADIVPKTGKGFAKWEFAEDTGDIKFKSEGDAGNQGIGQELNVYVPRYTPAIADVIAKALNGKYVVVTVDLKGQMMVGGSKLRGLKFDVDYNSGAKYNDKNGSAFKFTGGLAHPPLFYTGTLPLVDTAGVLVP